LKNETGIRSDNILVILFIEEISDASNIPYLFGENNIDDEENTDNLNCSLFRYANDDKNSIDVILTYKKEMNKYEMYKDFFIVFCNELRKGPIVFEAVPIFTIFLQVGVRPFPNSISMMVKSLITGDMEDEPSLMTNNVVYVRGAIIPENVCNIFTGAQNFDMTLDNTYSNHFGALSNSLLFSNKFSMLKTQTMKLTQIATSTTTSFFIYSTQKALTSI
jgi:hypothetical protein